MEDIIWETNCEKSLYPVRDEKVLETVFLASSENLSKKYGHWHRAVWHTSCEKVPFFPGSITNKFHSVPCVTSKMNEVWIKELNEASSSSTEIHHDFSGPFMDSLNKNKHALHVLNSRTSYSEAFALPMKVHATSLLQGFVTRVHNKVWLSYLLCVCSCLTMLKKIFLVNFSNTAKKT